MLPDTSLSAQKTGVHLHRVLTLWDLVFYGIVLIQPIAAIPLFGIADVMSRGHVVTTILIAMAAMMLTARSYGRMATVYPSAGSAYAYVGQELNCHLGFLAGWAMLLDYLAIPVINVIYGALTLVRLIPGVPYLAWATVIAVFITCSNLRGIRSTARTNAILLTIMCALIGAFGVLACRFLVVSQGIKGLVSWQPFYDPKTSDIQSIARATSLAALTYIGFDGVSTLSEEVENPKKNVLRATVLVCFVTGVFSGLQVYLAQLVWPNYTTFGNVETAFMDVSRKVGGTFLFEGMAVMLIVASIGSGLSAQAGASRLLFGMGRDNALPGRAFGLLHPKYGVPTYNILLIGVVSFVGAVAFNFELAAEIVNFGAFCAFMGVNVAAMKRFYLSTSNKGSRQLLECLLPGAGFLFCVWIFWNLPFAAKLVGSCWLVIGVLIDAVRTHGFRTKPADIDFTA